MKTKYLEQILNKKFKNIALNSNFARPVLENSCVNFNINKDYCYK